MQIILLLLFLSYFLGSIPFGLIITKISGYGDIRKIGSKNIGATNVLRVGNKKIAMIVLFLDFIKCYIPTFLGSHFFEINIGAFCGLFAILGHMFPIWLKFKGGKGVASLFGYILALNILFFLILGFIWLLIAFTTKYASLSSIISTIVMVFLFFIYDNNINIIIPLVISVLIIYQHRKNIKRLINNEENKIKIN